MLIVGLTGGIATGKSTVSECLRAHNVAIIDADVVAREIMEPGNTSYKLVVKEFGSEIIDKETGAIDRAKLGGIVFNDEKKRRVLNKCTHPYVRRRILYQLFKCYVSGHRMCVLDVPLLYESGMDRICNKVVVVACDEDKQLHRLMDRNGFTREEAESRISAQLPLADKVIRATRVIENNGSIVDTHKQVAKMVEEWTPSLIRTLGFLIAPVGVIASVPFVRSTAGLGTLCACAAWFIGSLIGA